MKIYIKIKEDEIGKPVSQKYIKNPCILCEMGLKPKKKLIKK